jgi:hypothetical protein
MHIQLKWWMVVTQMLMVHIRIMLLLTEHGTPIFHFCTKYSTTT